MRGWGAEAFCWAGHVESTISTCSAWLRDLGHGEVNMLAQQFLREPLHGGPAHPGLLLWNCREPCWACSCTSAVRVPGLRPSWRWRPQPLKSILPASWSGPGGPGHGAPAALFPPGPAQMTVCLEGLAQQKPEAASHGGFPDHPEASSAPQPCRGLETKGSAAIAIVSELSAIERRLRNVDARMDGYRFYLSALIDSFALHSSCK